MSISGADAQELETMARRMSLAADQLERIRASVRSGMYGVRWGGADSEQCRAQWERTSGPALARAAAGLREAADGLTRNAREQRQASAAGASASGSALAGLGGGGGSSWSSGLPGSLSKEDLDRLATFLAAAGGLADDAAGVAKMANLVVAILGGAKELQSLSGFPLLSVLLNGAEAGYWIASQGVSDARAWVPMAKIVGIGGGMALVAVASSIGIVGAAPIGAGAVAAGAGFFIADRINDGFLAATGQSLSDHMANASINDEIAAIEHKQREIAIDKSMSAQEIQRRADLSSELSREAQALTEQTKTPWGCLKVMFGRK